MSSASLLCLQGSRLRGLSRPFLTWHPPQSPGALWNHKIEQIQRCHLEAPLEFDGANLLLCLDPSATSLSRWWGAWDSCGPSKASQSCLSEHHNLGHTETSLLPCGAPGPFPPTCLTPPACPASLIQHPHPMPTAQHPLSQEQNVNPAQVSWLQPLSPPHVVGCGRGLALCSWTHPVLSSLSSLCLYGGSFGTRG